MKRQATLYLLFGILLLSLLGFLYFKTRSFEIIQSRHVNDDIRNITQADATLNRKLMEVSYGVLNYYDPLFQLNTRLEQLNDHLSGELKNIATEEPDIKLHLGMLQHTLDNKSLHLQDLISHIALLKNSRAYFPKTITDVKRKLESHNNPSALIDRFDRLLNHVLIYNLNGSLSSRQEARNDILKITRKLEHYPLKLRPAIRNLLTHARMLLQQKAQVDSLLQSTILLPVPHILEQLNESYHRYHTHRLENVERYRLLLFAFSAVLLFYLVYLLLHLQRTTRSLRTAVQESRQAQARLHLQASALSAADNGIVITDRDGNIEWVNPAFTRLTGYTQKEAIGHNPRLIQSGLHTESLYRELWDTILSGQVWRGELVNKRKNGELYHEEETITPVFDDRRKISHFIAIKQDISQRKQTEQALLRANRALQILSSTNQLLVRCHEEQELLQEICRILVEDGQYRFAWVGFAEQDADKRVRPIAQFGFNAEYLDSLKLSWGDNELGQGPTGKAIRNGHASVIRDIQHDPHYRHWRDNANKYGYRASIALPLQHDQKILGALNIYSGKTAAFDEDEILLLQELADDIAFGIMALRNRNKYRETQRQLYQAQKMEAIGQLTGGIAHDFNNILASIMGYTSLALERHVEDPDSKLGQYLQEVYRAGERARDLITQMLAFSRNSASAASPLSLPPLIKEVVRMLDATLPSEIHIHTQIEDGLPRVMMDPVQLHQIVMNLCINARDAIDRQGRIDIRLQTVELESGRCTSCHSEFSGYFVALSVQDNGHGIEPAIIPHIFDPFFTTKGVGKGTGMGLSTVHGIIHQHHGHIQVQSADANGTRFCIYLPPISEQSHQPREEEPVTEQHQSPLPAPRQAARIMIVEDDESIGRFILELLDSKGYQTRLFEDGESAWEYFQSHHDEFDLVITDQSMPGINGEELARKVLDLCPELPIILCSGNAGQIGDVQARNPRIRAFLQKPLSLPGLLDCIHELLHDETRRSQPAQL